MVSHAGQTTGVPRIRVMFPAAAGPNPFFDALRYGLGELGRAEGRDIAFEPRFTDRMDRLPDLAVELVALGVDAIAVVGAVTARAALRATADIPIVFAVVVMGGLGSIWGALIASLLIGMVQTASIGLDLPLGAALGRIGVAVDTSWFTDLWQVSIARVAPVVPYLLLVLVLALRPRGLMGTRST